MKITVIQKGNSRRVYLVNLKDWMNPDKFVINMQIPYIRGTDVIRKDNYEVAEFLDEDGDEDGDGEFFERRG
jgi:hypothetical protein